VYIPQQLTTDGTYVVYGWFCCVECAAGYLFAQTDISTSARFERFHLMHAMYAPTTSVSIRPAVAPHSLMTKFGGTLSAVEFREMIRQTATVYSVHNKPVTRIMPELLEEGEAFIKPMPFVQAKNKTDILHEKFKNKER
jgi:hypothetical protein